MLFSDDPSTKNGAVIVSPKGDYIGRGANALPQRIKKLKERLERPAKYDYIIHAEQNAIINAAQIGNLTIGATMYCPWAPCLPCARSIIQAGIVKLVAHKEMHDRTPERWKEEIKRAVALLEEAGVEYERVSGSIGGVKGIINGESWEP